MIKVEELITQLQALSNKKAVVHVEAPIQNEDGSYKWPEHPKDDTYSLGIWGVEDEQDSDGETILLKSCTNHRKIPRELITLAADCLKKWFELVEGVDPNGIEHKLYDSLKRQIELKKRYW